MPVAKNPYAKWFLSSAKKYCYYDLNAEKEFSSY